MNFQKLLSDYNLIDLEFQGSSYTWNNKRLGEANIKETIDRGLGNIGFGEEFQNAQVFHCEPVGSDHHLLVADCCYQEIKTPKVFKFEVNWIEHKDYLGIIAAGWKGSNLWRPCKVKEIVGRSGSRRRALIDCSKEFPNNNRKLVDDL